MQNIPLSDLQGATVIGACVETYPKDRNDHTKKLVLRMRDGRTVVVCAFGDVTDLVAYYADEQSLTLVV